MKIYLLCPVRLATKRVKTLLTNYVEDLEKEGHEIFYPARDNPYEEVDDIGDQICLANTTAILEADEVHIYWEKESRGSKFDLGVVYTAWKPIIILNKLDTSNHGPTFEKFMLNWPFGVEVRLIDIEEMDEVEQSLVHERLRALGYE